ncbi:MAG: tRNA CCA-pyrophosphorylase [Candidatus Syntrophoarchaeum sp.]|nr:tRNA CCA-pyrophosphorylase [Candidatus Syntrophoarchaeum sp.]
MCVKEVILITGRTLKQGSNLENKMSDAYFDAAARCEMNENLLTRIGASVGDAVKVSTRFGEVVVNAEKDDGLPDGHIFIPMGPWANAIVDPDTGGVGTPTFKGVPANIEKTDGAVLSVKDLIARYREG